MTRFRVAASRRLDGATPRSTLLRLLLALSLLAMLGAPPARAQQPAPGSEASGEARRVFEHARERLVQVRTLALPSRAQASTGSGFVVAEDGLVVTNYHVVSQAAAERGPYALEWVGVDASSGPLEIVAIDVRHDLALLRRKSGAPLPYLALAPETRELQRGERVFSLGKPLDLGFVVSEGLYNGVVERDLYGHLLFSGALNAGMSGGPALDADGRVIGINVARRLDGQLVSFLIPVRYLHELLAAPAQNLAELPQRLAEINRQLRLHQAAMVERVLAAPWPTQIQGPYRVPVLPDGLARCWGGNDADNENGLSTTSTQCNLSAGRFVSGNLILGTVRLDHRHVESTRLTDWAFWTAMRGQFANRVFGLRKDRQRTPPRCEEADVETAIGAQRVVFCLGGYHRFEGLFQMTLLTMTLTHPKASLSSHLYADGITEANARRLAQTFLESMRWNRAP
ncbi:MAG: trypsin-like peptidase domain-containing protein [Alphaproteobacteria bacterium]|nr:trypsin-like peptidase domain-containing protein [Alphaproteobacteria bacterium]